MNKLSMFLGAFFKQVVISALLFYVSIALLIATIVASFVFLSDWSGFLTLLIFALNIPSHYLRLKYGALEGTIKGVKFIDEHRYGLLLSIVVSVLSFVGLSVSAFIEYRANNLLALVVIWVSYGLMSTLVSSLMAYNENKKLM